MADSGLFVGFFGPVRGREKQAVQVFNEAVGLYTKLQQDGEIESWDAVFLEPHGGDLGGFFLLRGERDKLAQIRAGDEFDRLNMRAGLVVEGFGVVAADLGDRIASQMASYQEQVGELT
jgi:hypothetical protein